MLFRSVAAAGEAFGSRRPLAQYNLIDIDRDGKEWTIRLTRRGVTGPTATVTEISSEYLSPHASPKMLLRA